MFLQEVALFVRDTPESGSGEKMKVGDLVRIAPWCKGKGRMAIVIIVPQYLQTVRIAYLDTAEQSNARKSNLEVINGQEI